MSYFEKVERFIGQQYSNTPWHITDIRRIDTNAAESCGGR